MEEEKLLEYLIVLRDFGRIYTQKIISGNPKLKTDLKLSQIKALYAFRESGRLSMKELAEIVGVKLPNMSMMIDSLEKDGLVERERDLDDRRKVYVWLTPKGIKVKGDFLTQRHRIARGIFQRVDAADKTELLTSLGNVCRILEGAFKERIEC
ncbi:MAG: MarR family transcriptional regulator [Pseudomonadota bacterium]